MNKTLLTLTLALPLIMVSCKKEQQQTEAEKTATSLKELIKRENVIRVVVFESPETNFFNTFFVGDVGLNYRFEGGFFFLDNKAWNLGGLKKYELQRINNIQFLGLYIY